MVLKKVGIVLMLAFSSFAYGRVKIEAIDAKVSGQEVTVTIKLDKATLSPIEFFSREGLVQAEIKNAAVWPKIEKSIKQNDSSHEVVAYQFDKDTARVRYSFPHRSPIVPTHKISSRQSGNLIEIVFPMAVANDVTKVNKFDESYLDQLLKEKEEKNPADEVQLKLASTDKAVEAKANGATISSKEKTKEFSLTPYLVKFASFLVLILASLWGFLKIFKRGFFSKGKLGFLQADQSVAVLSSTFIAPKRSLMLVRAYKQVFLISNSETGINLISEVDDVADVLKQRERNLSGSNFDLDFEESQERPKDFKIKENVATEDTQGDYPPPAVRAKQNEERSVADQIKRKVKSLKALQ